MSVMLRPYGAQAVVNGIPLVTAGSTDLKANPTLASGDVQISKDGGAFVNIEGAGTFGDFVAVAPAAGTSVRLTIAATDMECKQIVVRFIDQTATKEWQDQEVIIETYGHASAMHPALPANVTQWKGSAAPDLPTNFADLAIKASSGEVNVDGLTADAVADILQDTVNAAAPTQNSVIDLVLNGPGDTWAVPRAYLQSLTDSIVGGLFERILAAGFNITGGSPDYKSVLSPTANESFVPPTPATPTEIVQEFDESSTTAAAIAGVSDADPVTGYADLAAAIAAINTIIRDLQTKQGAPQTTIADDINDMRQIVDDVAGFTGVSGVVVASSSKDGYTLSEAGVTAVQNGLALEATLDDIQATLEGGAADGKYVYTDTYVSSTGIPIAGATIRAYTTDDYTSTPEQTVTTDSTGTFIFRLAEGHYYCRADRYGYRVTYFEIDVTAS